MTFQEYCDYFESIVKKQNEEQTAPYDNLMYIDYTRLNWSRMNRWFKTASLTSELIDAAKKITTPQTWIIITEPWCGDAAHCVPFLEMTARENPLMQVSYELRDSPPFRINDYLTNNGKSIPKLVIKDTANNDVATWGPRPAGCQKVYQTLVDENADFEKVKTEIQLWYNANKGLEIMQELTNLLTSNTK